MSFKKFSYIFISVIFIFVLYNFSVWNIFTKKLLSNENGLVAGDLVRMGYFPELAKKKKTEVTLEKKHLEAAQYTGEQIDLITIGDSFSQGAAGGINNYYQDYISTYTGLNILNLANYQEKTRSYIETAYLLANSGFLERAGVKYIMLESVERKIVQRFARHVNPDMTDSLENIYKFYKFKADSQTNEKVLNKKEHVNNFLQLPETPFINNGNIKFLLYKSLYNFSENAYISQVYRVKLNKDLFTLGNKDLLFYTNDLNRIDMNKKDNLELINKNLNALAEFLDKRGIKLIFMPAVNKYDLYSKFIENNKYPEDQFFNIFDALEKKYIYINSKKLLIKELEKGEKDIYHVDDTHWSNKASNIVALDLKKQLEDND